MENITFEPFRKWFKENYSSTTNIIETIHKDTGLALGTVSKIWNDGPGDLMLSAVGKLGIKYGLDINQIIEFKNKGTLYLVQFNDSGLPKSEVLDMTGIEIMMQSMDLYEDSHQFLLDEYGDHEIIEASDEKLAVLEALRKRIYSSED